MKAVSSQIELNQLIEFCYYFFNFQLVQNFSLCEIFLRQE